MSDNKADNTNQLAKELSKRVARLEEAVFEGKTAPIRPKKSDDELFKGATGGIRLLVKDGFFDEKRRFGEIKDELDRRGYHYSKQAVQTPLNKLSKSGGPLVGFREKSRKIYAKRR